MLRKFAGKLSLLTVLFLIATLVPTGIANAGLSSEDYYSMWNNYGRTYPGDSGHISPDAPGNPNTPTPGDQSGTFNNSPANTSRTIPSYSGSNISRSNYYSNYYSNRSDYYNRYNNNIPGNNNNNTPGTSYPGSGSNNPTPGGGNNNTPPDNVGDINYLTADERTMLTLVNQERARAGLTSLTVDSQLVDLARMKSRDMYENNYFSHTSPTYGSAYDMERNAGYSARVMGAENIAKAATVTRAHELFMNSDGHRANILDSRHDYIGIGVANTSNGVYVTQLFAGD